MLNEWSDRRNEPDPPWLHVAVFVIIVVVFVGIAAGIWTAL